MNADNITIQHLSKSYPPLGGDGVTPTQVFTDFNVVLKPNQFVSVFGPNGSGKSTLLKILAGLEPFDSGSVFIGDMRLSQTDVSLGVVFQDYALFDWKTVRENIEFGLKARGVIKNTRHDIAQDYIDRVELSGHEHKYPYQLSGGLRQRTAIARALAVQPDLLLLDEPFAALDTQVRRRLQQLVLNIWSIEKRTLVLITHDIEEAVLMSDRVIVLSKAPARIIRDIDINLPRPRMPEMRFEKHFQAYLDEIQQVDIDE